MRYLLALALLSAATAQIAITGNASFSGATKINHSNLVTLTWNASTGADGYNVYRGTVQGGPYATPLCTGTAVLTCRDSSVQKHQTYYYVVTAYNANGESGYSNEAQAVIP